MPELPDLLYIKERLEPELRAIPLRDVQVKQPVVVRNAFDQSPAEVLSHAAVQAIEIHGPFLRFSWSNGTDVVLNLMLAGRLQWQQPEEKPLGHCCVAFGFANDCHLNVCDSRKMAKVYLTPAADHSIIPAYAAQGIDILSPSFSLSRFEELARLHGRKQIRVMINDHTILSSIGNAYADEILFEARIHPKTIVSRLSHAEIQRVFEAIRSTMLWGIEQVRSARRPIHEKIRDHMRVRNRHGAPCLRCGTTIRREGVRGYDVFFCPSCQPAARRLFINWNDSN